MRCVISEVLNTRGSLGSTSLSVRFAWIEVEVKNNCSLEGTVIECCRVAVDRMV